MKIAVDAREMAGQITGKGRYTVEVIRHLAAIDQENQYYLYTKQPIDLDLPKNFEVVMIGGLPGLRQLWLARDAQGRGCDLLFSPTGYLPVIFSAIPCVTTIHDLAIFVAKETKPAFKTFVAEKLLLGTATRKSVQLLAVSESTKKDLHRLFKVPNQKVTVTPLGYDQEFYTDKADKKSDEQLLKEYQLPADYLLFIGTLEPRKNIEGIIRAYGQLPAELRQTHRLVIAGKKGWFYDTIFATVTELGLEESVQFLGRVPDAHLPALYRQAKLFIFPSFYEGFGLPLLEALACGTPVISSNISSLPEVVGQAGLLIDPHNLTALTQAIQELLTNPTIYAKYQKETVQQAKRFTWAQTATQTLAVFQKVAKHGQD